VLPRWRASSIPAHGCAFTLAPPDPDAVSALYRDLAIGRAPEVARGAGPRYRAEIETPSVPKTLT
jgi:hypothetical protein